MNEIQITVDITHSFGKIQRSFDLKIDTLVNEQDSQDQGARTCQSCELLKKTVEDMSNTIKKLVEDADQMKKRQK